MFLRDVQVEEIQHRIDVEVLGEEDLRVTFGSMLAVATIESYYDDAFVQLRNQLLQRCNGLITREFLRAERWLEFTLQRLSEVVTAETKFRASIEALETRGRCDMDVRQLRLETLVIQGTQGTIVEVEELEREVRFHVIVFDEVAVREALAEQELDDFAAATVKMNKRRERQRQEQLALFDKEQIARWQIRDAEESPRLEIENSMQSLGALLYGLLQWRLIVAETNIRFDVEHDEDRVFHDIIAGRVEYVAVDADVAAPIMLPASEPLPPMKLPERERQHDDHTTFVAVAIDVAAESLRIEKQLSSQQHCASLSHSVLSSLPPVQPDRLASVPPPIRLTEVEVAAMWASLNRS